MASPPLFDPDGTTFGETCREGDCGARVVFVVNTPSCMTPLRCNWRPEYIGIISGEIWCARRCRQWLLVAFRSVSQRALSARLGNVDLDVWKPLDPMMALKDMAQRRRAVTES